ncbi:hypothetical protein BIFBRE_02875 [Bifidobacterium breve DSM 20213 = JCM 1192]|uniref:Uncharacterized protein n=1 Tax=Bifidobacterium breve DSM 20213 = JCM 1192 TaxID=518634 RepID=D4BLE3_BIFBR|nr:hypothetical protein BIFBRE_02875 [Bifidobacterium breve DSM 20213 = JCM 1192]
MCHDDRLLSSFLLIQCTFQCSYSYGHDLCYPHPLSPIVDKCGQVDNHNGHIYNPPSQK